MDVVAPTAAFINVQLVRAVNGNGLLHIPKKLLKIHDMPIILVVAIKTVGATNGLKEIVVVQFVIEINIGA